MAGVVEGRAQRMVRKIVRLLYRPKPAYELFVDTAEMTPWFLVISFPRIEEWDAYNLVRIVRKLLIDLAAISRRLDDKRAAMLFARMTTLADIALQTEPMEGEVRDGKLHDE